MNPSREPDRPWRLLAGRLLVQRRGRAPRLAPGAVRLLLDALDKPRPLRVIAAAHELQTDDGPLGAGESAYGTRSSQTAPVAIGSPIAWAATISIRVVSSTGT